MILTLASSRRAASQSVETSGSSVVDIVMDEYPFNVGHGRACPGHPRLHLLLAKTWMPGTKPGHDGGDDHLSTLLLRLELLDRTTGVAPGGEPATDMPDRL